ncbi:MAG: hypothetical protein JXA41_14300 [Deltaproteobacteria bacterium]|nr:hypothetical protein [Deltaproteobacteria bacterium]
MTQDVVPFKDEEEKRATGTTSLGGLPVYLDLATVMVLRAIIDRHLQIKQQGWTNRQIVMLLILLKLAGGDCLEDMRKLECNEGCCRVLERMEQKGMKEDFAGGKLLSGAFGENAAPGGGLRMMKSIAFKKHIC